MERTGHDGPSPKGGGPRRPSRWLFLGPGLGWWAIFLVIPVGVVLAYSVFRRGEFGGVIADFTLDNYARAIDPLYLGILFSSIQIALLTTVIAVLVGYPVAYFIATRPQRWRTPLLVLVVLPFWTSLLIRSYAWIVLLNREGLINRSLLNAGVIEQPLPLLNNEFAIVLGLIYMYLPLVVLPLYAALERINPELREASIDLGASPFRTFLGVTLPLSATGIAAGAIFVFVPSLGNFIVPDLLGGGLSPMIGNVIQGQFLKARDWPFGAALSAGVILLTVLLLLFQAWLLMRERRATAGVEAGASGG